MPSHLMCDESRDHSYEVGYLVPRHRCGFRLEAALRPKINQFVVSLIIFVNDYSNCLRFESFTLAPWLKCSTENVFIVDVCKKISTSKCNKKPKRLENSQLLRKTSCA